MRDILKPRELARLCGVSTDAVRQWCNNELIKFIITPGGHRRFRKQDVLKLLEAQGFPLPDLDKPVPVHILVVDSDEAYRSSLAGNLQKEADFEVEEAADGYQAGRIIGESEPDVLILNPVMPDSDGFKICRDIRTRDKSPRIKIIVVSDVPGDDSVRWADEVGADGCLAKPVNVELLIKLIRKAYRGAGKRKAMD